MSIDADWMPERLAVIEKKWRESRNPVYVWFMVAACCDHAAPFPPWVNEYLADCAKGLLDRIGRDVDIRNELKGIFGFTGWGQLAEVPKELEREKFAMAFAARIFAGERPRDA